MAGPDPMHPDEHAQRLAEALHGVDLSGGASTIGRDGMTVGDASRSQALKNGFTATHTSGASLLDAWKRWQASEDQRFDSQLEAISKALAVLERKPAARKSMTTTSESYERERHAMRKSRRRMAKVLHAGGTANEARTAGYGRYVKHGGQLGRQAWSRRVLA